MTSNLGAQYLDAVDEGKPIPATVKEQVNGAIRRHFLPEFINRIDEIIMYVLAAGLSVSVSPLTLLSLAASKSSAVLRSEPSSTSGSPKSRSASGPTARTSPSTSTTTPKTGSASGATTLSTAPVLSVARSSRSSYIRYRC